MVLKRLLLAATLAGVGATDLQGAFDWPQWQGPQRDAKSAETGLFQEWPKGGPPLAWRTTGLGAGMGGIAVADGRIYYRTEEKGEVLLIEPNRDEYV